MKYLVYTDNHFCETSSIVLKFGSKYTVRIENQLKSINWIEELAVNKHCDAVVCMGDFFNRQFLTDQEITAINDIQWNDLPHYFVVGNHESEEVDLKYSSAQILHGPNREIISEPKSIKIDSWEVCFLPYMVSRNIAPLESIFGPKNSSEPRLIFSHNDIKGIQYGPTISTFGFPIENIEAESDLFLNGHIHNGTKVSEKVINLGNLTGQDFKEDAFRYRHCAMLVETLPDGTFTCEYVENPYALNFYHIDIDKETDLKKFSTIKNQSVLSVRCKANLLTKVNNTIMDNINKITEKRIITYQDFSEEDTPELDVNDLSVDYLAELCTYCRAKLDNTPALEYVLAEICK